MRTPNIGNPAELKASVTAAIVTPLTPCLPDEPSLLTALMLYSTMKRSNNSLWKPDRKY